MAEELIWPVEAIPDHDSVFMRAHRIHYRDGEFSPGVFKPQGNGLSVDWDKYSTAEETRLRARKPNDNAVLTLPVGGIRAIKPLRVEHTPDLQRSNRAHSEVFEMPEGEQLAEARVLLLRMAGVAIPVSSNE